MLGDGTFYGCDSLKKIYVADGCKAYLSNLEIPDSTKVGPPPETMVGNARVWDLRGCKNIVIPEGVERIGNYWFWDSGIESITIAASVREVGTEAFYNCRNLRHVAFASGSKLEKIESGCFCASGIERIVVPSNVTVIEEVAFRGGKNLEKVSFQEGSRLEKIGPECFSGTAIKEFLAPQSLREIGDGAFYECRSLERVTLNEGLERLGECGDGSNHIGVFSKTPIK